VSLVTACSEQGTSKVCVPGDERCQTAASTAIAHQRAPSYRENMGYTAKLLQHALADIAVDALVIYVQHPESLQGDLQGRRGRPQA
jgi:hypothetical protein